MNAAAKRRVAPDARRDMQKELAAAAAIKYQIGALFGDDADLILLQDSIEGETDLFETIDRVLEQMACDMANVGGIEKFATTMAARKKRLQDRYDNLETMLLNALDIIGERRIERPLALVYTRAKPAKAVINDEALIPAVFFKTPDPELSKADLLAAMKDRRDTLQAKHDEITARVKAGEMNEQEEADARDRLEAAFPPFPGADLDEGGVAVSVKWS